MLCSNENYAAKVRRYLCPGHLFRNLSLNKACLIKDQRISKLCSPIVL